MNLVRISCEVVEEHNLVQNTVHWQCVTKMWATLLSERRGRKIFGHVRADRHSRKIIFNEVNKLIICLFS